MQALLVSAALVAAAEMGDKTQLLALALAARFRRPWPILAGILIATIANHLLAGVVGTWLAQHIAPEVLQWAVALSFFAFALWTLRPDSFDDSRDYSGGSVFITTAFAFFIAEMGDKTQLATVALAARYQSLGAVVAGTTLGMLLADAPVVWLGRALVTRLNLTWLRWLAAALFALLGVVTLVLR